MDRYPLRSEIQIAEKILRLATLPAITPSYSNANQTDACTWMLAGLLVISTGVTSSLEQDRTISIRLKFSKALVTATSICRLPVEPPVLSRGCRFRKIWHWSDRGNPWAHSQTTDVSSRPVGRLKFRRSLRFPRNGWPPCSPVPSRAAFKGVLASSG